MPNKITFVNPEIFRASRLSFRRKTAPYRLATLAGQVPPSWDVKIVDENVESLNYEDTDIAAITVPTQSAPRAYEIAEEFSERGVSVLLGGIHPTALPEESKQYGTVVAGEAENILSKVIEDYEMGVLKSSYDGLHVDMKKTKMPRFDLLKGSYFIQPIQFSRGCPNGCEPCSASLVNGPVYRTKEHQAVIDEINASRGKFILFTDDNFAGNNKKQRENVKKLLRKMKGEMGRTKLSAQVTVEFTKDREMMKLASEANFTEFLIGIEDTEECSLREIGKTINYNIDYKKDVVGPMHDYGFSVTGSFMLGMDSHDKGVFSRYVDFVKDVEIDNNAFLVLTPFPGTKFKERLEREGRIVLKNYPNDWVYYDTIHAVFEPKNMTLEELQNGTLEAIREVGNPVQSCVRALKSFKNTRNIYGTVASLLINNTSGQHARKILRDNTTYFPDRQQSCKLLLSQELSTPMAC